MRDIEILRKQLERLDHHAAGVAWLEEIKGEFVESMEWPAIGFDQQDVGHIRILVDRGITAIAKYLWPTDPIERSEIGDAQIAFVWSLARISSLADRLERELAATAAD